MSAAGYHGPQLNHDHGFHESGLKGRGLDSATGRTSHRGWGLGAHRFGSLGLSFYIWTWRDW